MINELITTRGADGVATAISAINGGVRQVLTLEHEGAIRG